MSELVTAGDLPRAEKRELVTGLHKELALQVTALIESLIVDWAQNTS